MKKLSMFLVTAVIAAPMFAQSAPSRVAVINVQKVLVDSAAGKVALEKLKKVQDEKAARAQKMSEEIASLEQQINQRRLSLADDKLAELQKQFSEKKIALQRFAQDADRELQEQRDRELQALNDRIMPIINDLGKEMGFAVIFNKFEAGLVYASEAIDITDVVIKRFNEMAQKQAAK
ncbi:MAG TPA: OmpH family outer membrane protein [Thermoanaerobaculia bacterium]|nr:OmpH family outer membrane protein [Thermoanaerobaculia bacterium]